MRRPRNIRAFVRRRLRAGDDLDAAWRALRLKFRYHVCSWGYVRRIARALERERAYAPDSAHRFAPIDLAGDYVMLGWMPHPTTEGTAHGDYRVHVEWACCCGRRPPVPAEERGRAELRRPPAS